MRFIPVSDSCVVIKIDVISIHDGTYYISKNLPLDLLGAEISQSKAFERLVRMIRAQMSFGIINDLGLQNLFADEYRSLLVDDLNRWKDKHIILCIEDDQGRRYIEPDLTGVSIS